METGPWDVVVYGTAVDRATGETRPVAMGWRAGELGAWFLESGGRTLRSDGIPAEHVARYTRLIFPPDGDGGESRTVADPVGMDGRPRPDHRLLDRRARRGLETRAMVAD